jgi:hypothetical protein
MLQSPNGERSAVQVKSVRYDHAPEVHQQVARLERRGKSVEQVHFAVCKQKMETLRNYMNLKSAREVYLSNVHQYNLNNSMVPAIQEHIMINMNIPASKREDLCNTALSYKNIFNTFKNACRHVQDWT